jgi:hypothetical protein
MVTAVVKANTVLFMSLILSGFFRTFNGRASQRVPVCAVGSEFGKVWAWGAAPLR